MQSVTTNASHAPQSIQAGSKASRDLQITGATRKNTSWEYHIEVLDVRASGSVKSDTSAQNPNARSNSSETIDATAADDNVYLEMPPMVRYTVMRRYTDFRQLYTYLVETQGSALREALPRFPNGGWISYLRGDDPDLLHHRRARLERFLRAVDARPELRWSVAFTTFLRPDLGELAPTGTSTVLPSVSDNSSFVAASSLSSSDMDPRIKPFTQLSPLSSLPPQQNFAQGLEASNVAAASSSGGYVSLSHLKSPEIRFRKKLVPGGPHACGDLKRRRLHLHSQNADDMDSDQRKPSAKKQLALALSGALGFKRFFVGVGSGVIGTLGRIGCESLDSVDTAEDQDGSDSSDTDEDRRSSECANTHNSNLLKMLSSGGS
ncbi:hypothetical protein CCR75_003528 [Bremia lactucae]|uniref:PX domain-containing protein n=1 Tax=Bremia lactucae TaxID=4779 RepID=A0A976FSH5_BRELC|nr:hypothetical protein CCR75_003528 [Bremia lactucae]